MKITLKLAVSIGTVIILAILLIYLKSLTPDPKYHNAIIDQLQNLKQANATLNESLFDVTSHKINNYDSLGLAQQNLSLQFDLLNKHLSDQQLISTPEIQHRLEELGTIIANKHTFIEHFKMDNALLRNSMNYYPTISDEIKLVVNKNNRYQKFQDLTQSVMFYVMTGDNTWYKDATIKIEELKNMLRSNNPAKDPSHPLLTNYLAHSEVIIKEKNLQLHHAPVEQELPVNKLIDSLHNAYMNYYAAKTSGAEIYRTLMLATSLILTLIIVYIMTLLGRYTKALSVEKEKALAASHSKSTFLANMSHEIRTPLTSIIGFGEAMLDNNQTMEERLTAVQAIVRSGKHLLSVINEILDISKIESGKLETEIIPVDLFHLLNHIESAVRFQAESKGLSFGLHFDSPLPEKIQTDPVRLKQILLNLCNNAIKFTEHGSIQLRVNCLSDQEKIRFSVIDTGIGLSKEHIDILFEPFAQADPSTTRKYGGTGLGLHISKKLAQRLGGDISITSEQHRGSRFDLLIDSGPLQGVLFLDNSTTNSKSNRKSMKFTTPPKLDGTVLLVEDNPDNQQLISFYIRKSGAAVTITANGKQAMAKALAHEYDLILMDMQMCEMDGIEATRRLREAGYNKPIVALTANAFHEEEAKCRDAGCNDFLSKPIDWNKFFAVLTNYLTVKDQSSRAEQPLISELIESEPGLKNVVNKFINGLPDILTMLVEQNKNQDWGALAKTLHDLKGMGAGFGFPQLTTLATRMEIEVKQHRHTQLSSSLNELERLVLQIAAGVKSNE